MVFGVKGEQWAFKLEPQLTGKAQKAFAAMDEKQAGDYDELKKAILKHYNVSSEICWHRWRTVVREGDESNQEVETRVMELVQNWMGECRTVQEVLEMVAAVELNGRGVTNLGARGKAKVVHCSR